MDGKDMTDVIFEIICAGGTQSNGGALGTPVFTFTYSADAANYARTLLASETGKVVNKLASELRQPYAVVVGEDHSVERLVLVVSRMLGRQR
jgi:hypothetical protein